jgi:hypothetical protein
MRYYIQCNANYTLLALSKFSSGLLLGIFCAAESDEPAFSDDLVVNMEDWDSILFKLNDNKRYRRIVASIAVSCLTAVTPLLASEKEPVCLIALNIIEVLFSFISRVLSLEVLFSS